MFRFFLTWVVFFVIAIPGVTHSAKIPATPAAAQADKDFQKALQKLSNNDRRLVAQYMMRMTVGAAISGTNPPASDVTIQEAIAAQKKLVAEKNDTDTGTEEIIKQLEAAVRISNITVEPAPKGRYMDGAVAVTLDITNITEKTIAGIRVRADIIDVFGEPLDGWYGLQTDKDIKPGEAVTLTTVARGIKFLKADQNKVKKTAQAFHIVFSDGSQIKNPRY